MDTWNEHLESVKQFIVMHNKKPPKTTSIGCWLSDQLCFYRGNKGWAANSEFAERKAVFADFLRTHEIYMMTRDEIWDNKLKEVDDFIVRNNSVPTGTTNKSLSVWWLEQVSQSKTNKMPNNRIDKWNAFVDKHNKILYAEHDLWNANLQKSIHFIEANKKRPSSSSKNSEEKLIGQWIVNQLQAKTLDIDKKTLWDNFLKTYNEYFLSDDEMWNKNMEEITLFYNNYGKLPSHTSKCDVERKLGTWAQTQKKNQKLDNFVNTDRKTIWKMFINNVEKHENKKPIVETPIGERSAPVIKHLNIDKCAGKDRNGGCCRNYASDNSRYCKYHAYMTEYTDDVIAILQFCKACQKWKQIEPDRMQCLSCYEIRKTYVAELKEKEKSEIVLCKRDGCTNKKSLENDYCGKHQLQLFVNECVKEGLRPCVKYLKGCRAKLDAAYKRSSCADCLDKERKRDYDRRNGVSIEVSDAGTKQCTVCCAVKPVADYQPDNSSGELTKTCKQCRNMCKIQDAKRDKEHRNELARKAEQKPERVAKKKAWKEENYEKVVKAGLDYKHRLIENDHNAYLLQQTTNMKKWRDNNPDKAFEIYKKQKTNINKLYTNFLERIFETNYENEYTIDTFSMAILMPCYYCNIEANNTQYNGIDRFDNTIGYTMDNTVTACKLCNLTKGCLHGCVFWKRVIHILSHQNMIDNKQYYYEAFPDCGSISFFGYMQRAIKLNIEYSLTIDMFNCIITNPCYICGKIPSDTHRNGLDRVDNSLGYTEQNVKSCCSECNYMKKTQSLANFLNRLMAIYNNCNDIDITNEHDSKNKMIVVNANKKTKQEIKSERQRKKNLRKLAQQNKYCDEEWKILHTNKLVEKRKQV